MLLFISHLAQKAKRKALQESIVILNLVCILCQDTLTDNIKSLKANWIFFISEEKMRKLINVRLALVNKVREVVDLVGPEVVESFEINRIVKTKSLTGVSEVDDILSSAESYIF